MNASHFRQAIAFMLCLCMQTALPQPSADNWPAPETKQTLDRRVHQGYESWERPLPTHVKAQYAGGMGFLSFGAGWDYGRKCRWETDILIGFLPKAYSNRTHTIYTLKQNYIPWSISCCDRFAIEPLTCGVYLNLISGEDYWVREPDRYPDAKYYWFTSRLRTFFYIGQRFTYI